MIVFRTRRLTLIQCETVEVRQTHISAVFLTGDYVYKVKKPVNYGFVDFGTLAKRRHYCDEEVRLNRRLAPDVYIGVVPVTRRDAQVEFEGNGEVVEWAVKMRRLPDEATLQTLLHKGEIHAEVVKRLAHRIATFHAQAESGHTLPNMVGLRLSPAMPARTSSSQPCTSERP